MSAHRSPPPTPDAATSTSPADADVLDLPRTVAELPFFAAGRFPKPDLLGQCEGSEVRYTGGRELLELVRNLSLGLTALGMTRGDRVALLSESRPEWLMADFAILTAGAVTTPIYTTLPAEQIGFILRDSGAAVAIVSSPVQLEKLLVAAPVGGPLRTVILIDPVAPDALALAPPGLQVVSWADTLALGHRRIRDGWGVAREFHDAARQVRSDDLATIIYTSGTTGEPKGVMLTHGNLIANLRGVLQMLDLSHDDVALSFLPLCHAFERIVAYVYLCTGISVAFAESLDTISRDLLTVRPTVMSGVPRVFEKLYARILERGSATSGPRRWLFDLAIRVARVRGERLPEGRSTPLWARVASPLVQRVVFAKIHAGIGGRLRYAVSGSAPLAVRIARFFYGIGLPILEGYGLTETSPVLCVMPLREVRFGTVGPPLPNVELRIADDGEILARGPNVMAGYHNRPEATAEALAGGWFHTGDIGEFDARGFLRITDRKKDVLVTSGGKKITPQPIEQRLRAHTLVAEAIMVGDRRHFPAVLIVPEFSRLAAHLALDEATLRATVNSLQVRSVFDAIVQAVNDNLAQFERIKKFALLSEELTMADGALTPTLKVKRRVVEDRYRDVIEMLYR
ncbi:MAG: long-chain fatty acid--CoA ligase [Vicinamibacterales bacterium]